MMKQKKETTEYKKFKKSQPGEKRGEYIKPPKPSKYPPNCFDPGKYKNWLSG